MSMYDAINMLGSLPAVLSAPHASKDCFLFSFSHALNDESDNVCSQFGNVVHGDQNCK